MRELENLVRRLAALYPQDVDLRQRSSRRSLRRAGAPPSPADAAEPAGRPVGGRSSAILARLFRRALATDLPPPGLYHRILREVEAPLITAALAATRGNQIKAAELLGLNRNTLRKKIRDLDIQVIRSPGT